jgi:hypothetical protein
MQYGGIDDERALAALAGAIVAQAAMDYVQDYPTRPGRGELPALDFLEAAGLVDRAAEIVRYSPMLNGRKRNNTEAQRVAA